MRFNKERILIYYIFSNFNKFKRKSKHIIMGSTSLIINEVKVDDLQSPLHILYKFLVSDLCPAIISPIRSNSKLLPCKMNSNIFIIWLIAVVNNIYIRPKIRTRVMLPLLVFFRHNNSMSDTIFNGGLQKNKCISSKKTLLYLTFTKTGDTHASKPHPSPWVRVHWGEGLSFHSDPSLSALSLR